jgi:hypothetical protein
MGSPMTCPGAVPSDGGQEALGGGVVYVAIRGM